MKPIIKEVRRLKSQAQNLETVSLTKHFLLTSTLALSAFALAQTNWGFLPSALILSIVFFRAFSLMHDASHSAAHSNSGLNQILGIFYGALCFLPFGPWRVVHLEHHKWTGNIEKDPVMKLVRDLPKMPPRLQKMLNLTWKAWLPIMALLQNIVLERVPKEIKSSKRLRFFGLSWIHNLHRSLALVTRCLCRDRGYANQHHCLPHCGRGR